MSTTKDLTGRTRSLAPWLLLGLAACTQNTGLPPDVTVEKLPQNNSFGLGFDPGIDLVGPCAPEAETGLAGALIPGPGGGPARKVSFFAFTTAMDAEELDRSPSPPMDSNMVADVFLAAIADTRVEVNGVMQPAAFSQAMANAFRAERCMKCHSFHFEGGFGDTGTAHPGGESQQNNAICLNCHDVDIGVGENGEPIEWRAPLLAEQGDIQFVGKTPFTLCNQVKDNVSDPEEHFGNDTRIFWAMELALVPTGGEAPGGATPFRKAHFDELVTAWVDGGCQCTTADAVRDIAVVSVDSPATGTGNGESRRPSIAFVHNPAYDPDVPASNVAGWVYVAYESTATNLVVGFGNSNGAGTDVWRAQVEVRMDEDPSGFPEPGAVNLVPLSGTNALVSVRSPGGAEGGPAGPSGGNGASSRPAISSDGELVVFQSLTTDGANTLVSGFVDVNGLTAADVYVHHVATAHTSLVSRSFGTTGGNGASSAPSISAHGDAVAFETLADDLSFADDNGLGDVYYARLDPSNGDVLALFQASVRTGGVQATGGDSRAAAIFSDLVSGQVRVVFESDKTDLVGPASGVSGTNVYVHTGPTQPTTRLLSQVVTAGEAFLADGSSSTPAISPDGRWALYQTAATNLDALRALDANGAFDVVRVDLDEVLGAGLVQGRRLSVANEGSDGDGASTAPYLAGFLDNLDVFDAEALAAYTTQAQNLGTASDPDTGLPTTDRNLAILAD